MILKTIDRLEAFVKDYSAAGGPLAVDTETDGKVGDWRICGFSLGYWGVDRKPVTCYVPIRHEVWNPKPDLWGRVETVENLDPERAIETIRFLLEEPTVLTLAHNAKYETKVFKKEGVEIENLHCTLIMAYLADPTTPNGLKPLLARLFQKDLTPVANLGKWFRENGLGKEHKRKYGYKYVPLEIIGPYGEDIDAAGCLELFEYLKPQMAPHRSIYAMEWRLLPVIARMELRGFPICLDELERVTEVVETDLEEARSWMFEIVGREFVPSPEQVGQILYKELGLDIPDKRGKGLTDAKTLKKLNHPLADAILAWRALDKIRGSFLVPLKRYAKKGRIHSSFKQVKSWGDKDELGEDESETGGTDTGRLSSDDPNMQQISKPRKYKLRGKKKSLNIRTVFRIPKRWLGKLGFLLSDWSQVEMRLLAEESQDATLIRAFLDGKDMHSATAEKVFKCTVADMDPNDYMGKDTFGSLSDDDKRAFLWKSGPRKKAKAVNFGIVYGQGPRSLAAENNWTMEEALQFIRLYFKEFPTVKEWSDRTIAFAEQHGYIETRFGRRRYLPKEDAYKAPNTVIQGGAADMNKIAITRVDKVLEPYQSQVVLNIHDDITTEFWFHEVEVPGKIKREMEYWPDFRVPIVVDQEMAERSWGETRDFTAAEKQKYFGRVPALHT